MKAEEQLAGLETKLGASGLNEVELYLKRGRSRRFEIGSHGRIAGTSEEEGWAVRASDERSSLFAAGSGADAGFLAGSRWSSGAASLGPTHLRLEESCRPGRPPVGGQRGDLPARSH